MILDGFKDSEAANPGGVKLNAMVWLKHCFVWPIIWSSAFAVFLLLSVYVSLWFMIVAVPMALANYLYWNLTKKGLLAGHSSGGIVISESPALIAIRSDLSHGEGDYPVLNVLRYKGARKVKNGERIATVSVYNPAPEEDVPHWANIHTYPIEYATKSQEAQDQAFASYSSEVWEDLEQALTQLSQPYEAGLYAVDPHESEWRHLLGNEYTPQLAN